MTVEANHMIMHQTWVVNTLDYSKNLGKESSCRLHSLLCTFLKPGQPLCSGQHLTAASKFFELVENVYCFFTASTHWWELLVNVLGGLSIVKHLSDTRWAAHSDASKALWIWKNKDGFRAIYRKPWRKQPKHDKKYGVFYSSWIP